MADVPAPLYISSRLMAALDVPGVGTLEVGDYQRELAGDHAGRIRYGYNIYDQDGTLLDAGKDLFSGNGADVDYKDTMASLLGFLTAAAESYPDGENADLFNERTVEWAYQHSEELALAELELTGEDD